MIDDIYKGLVLGFTAGVLVVLALMWEITAPMRAAREACEKPLPRTEKCVRHFVPEVKK